MAYLFLTLILKLPGQHARHVYFLWTPSSIPATNVESATHRWPTIKGMCCLRTLESCDAVFSMFLGKHRPPAPPWLRLMVVRACISEKCFSSFSGHKHYRGAWGKTDCRALTSRNADSVGVRENPSIFISHQLPEATGAAFLGSHLELYSSRNFMAWRGI